MKCDTNKRLCVTGKILFLSILVHNLIQGAVVMLIVKDQMNGVTVTFADLGSYVQEMKIAMLTT